MEHQCQWGNMVCPLISLPYHPQLQFPLQTKEAVDVTSVTAVYGVFSHTPWAPLLEWFVLSMLIWHNCFFLLFSGVQTIKSVRHLITKTLSPGWNCCSTAFPLNCLFILSWDEERAFFCRWGCKMQMLPTLWNKIWHGSFWWATRQLAPTVGQANWDNKKVQLGLTQGNPVLHRKWQKEQETHLHPSLSLCYESTFLTWTSESDGIVQGYLMTLDDRQMTLHERFLKTAKCV